MRSESQRKFARAASILSALLILIAAVTAVFPDAAKARSTAAPSAAPSRSPTAGAAASPRSPTRSPGKTPVPSAYAASLESVRICLDPGHQRKRDSKTEPIAPWSDVQKARTSSGTQGVKSGVPEYEYTLEFSQELAKALRARGADVILTRESHDVMLSNIERAEIGNAFQADVALRIHCDGSENAKKQGIGLFVADRADADGISKAYAQALLESLVRGTGARSGGVRASDEYTGLNWSEVPAILVELGYMSNAEEDARLQTEAYRKKLIDGIVGWCEAQFGVKKGR